MQAACRQLLTPCCCCSPGWCDALVHAGRGIALPQLIRCIPADAKPVPVQVAKPEVVGQGGVLQALPGVIRLLDDGPVRPCVFKWWSSNRQRASACCMRCADRSCCLPAATARMLVHGLLLWTSSNRQQLLTQHYVSNEPGGPYVGHQPAHRGCPFCWYCYCCCAETADMPLSDQCVVPIGVRQSQLIYVSRDTRTIESFGNLEQMMSGPAAAVAKALFRNGKLPIWFD